MLLKQFWFRRNHINTFRYNIIPSLRTDFCGRPTFRSRRPPSTEIPSCGPSSQSMAPSTLCKYKLEEGKIGGWVKILIMRYCCPLRICWKYHWSFGSWVGSGTDKITWQYILDFYNSIAILQLFSYWYYLRYWHTNIVLHRFDFVCVYGFGLIELYFNH